MAEEQHHAQHVFADGQRDHHQMVVRRREMRLLVVFDLVGTVHAGAGVHEHVVILVVGGEIFEDLVIPGIRHRLAAVEAEDAAVGFGDLRQAVQGVFDQHIRVRERVQLLGDLVELVEQVFLELHVLHLGGEFPGDFLREDVVLFQQLDGAVLLDDLFVRLEDLQRFFPVLKVVEHPGEFVIGQRKLVDIGRFHEDLDGRVQLFLGGIQVLAFQQGAQVVGFACLEALVLLRGHFVGLVQIVVRAFVVAREDEVVGLFLEALDDLVAGVDGFEEVQAFHQVGIGFLEAVELGEHAAEVAVQLGLDVFVAHLGQQFQALEAEVEGQVQLVLLFVNLAQVAEGTQQSLGEVVLLAFFDGLFIEGDGLVPVAFFEPEGAEVVQRGHGVAVKAEVDGGLQRFGEGFLRLVIFVVVHQRHADVVVDIGDVVGLVEHLLQFQRLFQILQGLAGVAGVVHQAAQVVVADADPVQVEVFLLQLEAAQEKLLAAFPIALEHIEHGQVVVDCGQPPMVVREVVKGLGILECFFALVPFVHVIVDLALDLFGLALHGPAPVFVLDGAHLAHHGFQFREGRLELLRFGQDVRPQQLDLHFPIGIDGFRSVLFDDLEGEGGAVHGEEVGGQQMHYLFGRKRVFRADVQRFAQMLGGLVHLVEPGLGGGAALLDAEQFFGLFGVFQLIAVKLQQVFVVAEQHQFFDLPFEQRGVVFAVLHHQPDQDLAVLRVLGQQGGDLFVKRTGEGFRILPQPNRQAVLFLYHRAFVRAAHQSGRGQRFQVLFIGFAQAQRLDPLLRAAFGQDELRQQQLPLPGAEAGNFLQIDLQGVITPLQKGTEVKSGLGLALHFGDDVLHHQQIAVGDLVQDLAFLHIAELGLGKGEVQQFLQLVHVQRLDQLGLREAEEAVLGQHHDLDAAVGGVLHQILQIIAGVGVEGVAVVDHQGGRLQQFPLVQAFGEEIEKVIFAPGAVVGLVFLQQGLQLGTLHLAEQLQHAAELVEPQRLRRIEPHPAVIGAQSLQQGFHQIGFAGTAAAVDLDQMAGAVVPQNVQQSGQRETLGYEFVQLKIGSVAHSLLGPLPKC